MQLDSYDLKILQILSTHGRITKSALAEAINLSASPCWERVKRLEDSGVIQGYCARIDASAFSKTTAIFMEITLDRHSAATFLRFESEMERTPEVVDCYATGGGVDYLVKVKMKDIDQYQRLIDRWLGLNIGISRYYTYIVTKSIKRSDPLSELMNAVHR